MREHHRDRYHRRIGNEEECQDRIAEDILKSRSPALGKHLFKYRYQTSCNDGSQLWTTILEHVKRYRVLLICGIKEDDVIGSRLGDIREDGLREVSVWVDDCHTTTIQYIRIDHVLKECRFSHTGFSDDIDMTSTVDWFDTE